MLPYKWSCSRSINTIVKVCISELYINHQQLSTTSNKNEFLFDKYNESCGKNNIMATSTITIKNGQITSDFCSITKRPLFNGNKLNYKFKNYRKSLNYKKQYQIRQYNKKYYYSTSFVIMVI